MPSVEELDFSPGKGAYEFEPKRFAARLSDDTLLNADAGDYFEYSLEVSARKVSIEMELLRAKMVNRAFHVIATYYDDSRRCVTNMRFSAKGDSGGAPSEFNGYKVVAKSRLDKPAPYIGGEVNVIGGPYEPSTPPDLGSGVQIVPITATDATYTYEIPTGKWLVGWEVRSTDAQSPRLGTTPGGSELGEAGSVAALETWIGQGNMLPTWTATNIYFSGLTGTNSIKLWLLG